MGMYTHLKLDIELKPEHVDEVEYYIARAPRMQSSSYYFYDKGINEVERDYRVHSKDAPPLCILHTDISLKNYENEIDTFLTFLEDKVNVSSYDLFCGFSRYEEAEDPSLIYYVDGKFIRKTVA